ncbi:MAG: hypothetical protein LBV67_09945 [Streptococcaceae bacterium]|nr:hypothetical protein [Streptococcaceae bacterium]
MDGMDKLKYISTEQMFEGILVEVKDASVTIDVKGRLGQFKIPRRMIISEHDLEIGQEVGFVMSYPEVLDPEPNQDYVNALAETQRRKEAYQANIKKLQEEQEKE